MDRDLAAGLTQVTTDDDTQPSQDVLKDTIKRALKAKDAAVTDFVATVTKLLTDGSFKVKLKTLRVMIFILNEKKKSGKIRAACGGAFQDAVAALVEFEMPPDPDHGDKPQQMVRTSAQRCLGMLDGGGAAESGGGGFAQRARAKAAAAAEKAQAKVGEAAAQAQAKMEEAKDAAHAKLEEAQAGRAVRLPVTVLLHRHPATARE
jgi:hypothetical protein